MKDGGVTGIRLNELKKPLEKLAERDQRTLSAYIRKVLSDHLAGKKII